MRNMMAALFFALNTNKRFVDED